MSRPLRHTSPAAAVLAWLALGALAAITFLGAVTVLDSAPALAHEYPEYAKLEIPLSGAALGLLVCIEVALALIASLVAAIHSGRIFEEISMKLVDALIATFIAATAVCVAGWLLIPGPPPLGLAIIGAIVAGISCVFILIVLRSLLRQAATMRLDLDAVI